MKLVNDFEQAAVELSWKGSQPPEEHHSIELRYQLTKKRLLDALRKPDQRKEQQK